MVVYRGRFWLPALLGRFLGQFRALEGVMGGDMRPIYSRIVPEWPASRPHKRYPPQPPGAFWGDSGATGDGKGLGILYPVCLEIILGGEAHSGGLA